MLWLVVAPDRVAKHSLIMNALHSGFQKYGVKSQVVVGEPPNKEDPFIIAGQLFTSETMIPRAMVQGQPFWQVDNGFYQASGKGNQLKGNYRITYKSPSPIFMNNPGADRLLGLKEMRPWRGQTSDDHTVVIGYPGTGFGRPFGMKMMPWIETIKARVEAQTNRKVIEREKTSSIPLEEQLRTAHVLITHSSNVGVEAAYFGIPVICEKTSPTEPICSLSLDDMENPPMPDRGQWWISLMSQQFTLKEMANGTAWPLMKRVQEQTDGGPLSRGWFGS